MKPKRAHKCLKVIELIGFRGEEIECEFICYIINNTVALERIIIDPSLRLLELGFRDRELLWEKLWFWLYFHYFTIYIYIHYSENWIIPSIQHLTCTIYIIYSYQTHWKLKIRFDDTIQSKSPNLCPNAWWTVIFICIYLITNQWTKNTLILNYICMIFSTNHYYRSN